MPRLLGVAAVAHHSAKKGAQNQAAADQQAADQQAAAAAAAAPVAAPVPEAPAVDPMTAQLQNLANLHTQGILNDEEYAAAKAKALGI